MMLRTVLVIASVMVAAVAIAAAVALAIGADSPDEVNSLLAIGLIAGGLAAVGDEP